jgi:hypothetical protein
MDGFNPTVAYLLFAVAVAIPAHALSRQFLLCSLIVGAACSTVAVIVIAALCTGQHVNFGFAPILGGVFGGMGIVAAMLVGMPFALWRRVRKRKPTPVAHFVD